MDGLETRQKLEALERRLLNDVGRCVKEHDLLEEGDRVMVAVSGGKDSYTLLHLLRKLQARAPVRFELMAVTLDQGQPGFEGQKIQDYMDREGIPFRMLRQDTYSVVLDKVQEGKTYCSLCSRLRRGVLYRFAGEEGFNKIALGHHRDDLIETLLLNVLYAGQIKSMPARLTTDDGRFEVIRPMALVAESRIIEFAALMQFPILPCNLCGSQDGLHRQKIKRLLEDLSAENPAVKGNVLASLGQVIPSHLLDRGLLERLAP
ncbi:MAG: tRNA 2-thiocytidine(32) synthetase TtcA [Deltaproteobacteria bacterium]|nr:tRNA 2-thiocytidine(32) synthetase TtcA [Deltaproteobacteria bacterium]